MRRRAADRGRLTAALGGASSLIACVLPFCMAPAQAFAREADVAEAEIIVTAQRRAERAIDLPMSLTAYDAGALEKRGVRRIEDLATLTAGLSFTRSASLNDNNTSDIALRGVFSDRGAGTTAIYVDDTPIQIRAIAYREANIYPRVFDLERVEVLRGPQGALFGASAMGGAVRFIQPSPSFGAPELLARAETSVTENGAPSGEFGVAGGAALSDRVAVRASAWARRDGGYVDQVDPLTGAVVNEDINGQDAYAGKLALTFAATPRLRLTPSLYVQKTEADGRDLFWLGRAPSTGAPFSRPDDNDYRTGLTNREASEDEFLLAALKIDWEGEGASVFSNTSFFERDLKQGVDYLNYLSALRSGAAPPFVPNNPFFNYANKDPSNATASQTIGQRIVTQEVRAQSNGEGGLSWLIGVFFSQADQDSTNLSESGRIPGTPSRSAVTGIPYPQYLGRYNRYELAQSTDRQYAVFGGIDLRLAETITLSAHLRAAHAETELTSTLDGPTNEGVRTVQQSGQDATSTTPRFALRYQPNPDTTLYANAAKGYRLGGGQSRVQLELCGGDLYNLYVDPAADPFSLTSAQLAQVRGFASPPDYEPDELWSYEVGSKNNLFGGALFLDASAYLIEWSDVQQLIRLPTCGYSFVQNLGEVTGKGVDLTFALRPTAYFEIGANVGYNETTYDDDQRLTATGTLLKAKGQSVGGPRWSGSAYVAVERPLSAGVESYARLDYAFRSAGAAQDPRAFGFDANLPRLSSAEVFNARAGVTRGRAELSIFVDNLTNSADLLSLGHDTQAVTSLYYGASYRPRTIGLALAYRR